MEHTDDPDRMQALLNEHRGWSAIRWKFSPSLRRLVLRVYHFQEARELYVEKVSNLTRYLSSVAYLTAVEEPGDVLAAGLYGATIICAGGLQIAEGEIPMV